MAGINANIRSFLWRAYVTAVPESVRYMVSRGLRKRLFSDISAYFSVNEEEKKKYAREIEYLNSVKTAAIFPYDYAGRYRRLPVEAARDARRGLWFVMHGPKRLYFPRGYTKKEVIVYYRNRRCEQDAQSPHRYMSDKLNETRPEVVFEAGCAEAMLTLDLIDTLKKAYIFESDARWVEALEATFEPYKEKTEIINKYVSDKDGEGTVRLDSIAIPGGGIGRAVIKLDVEGAERSVLDGAEKLLSRDGTAVLCCTYHRQNDAVELDAYLRERGFKTEFSDGYMLFTHDKKLRPPYFRKGLIRAEKQ